MSPLRSLLARWRETRDRRAVERLRAIVRDRDTAGHMLDHARLLEELATNYRRAVEAGDDPLCIGMACGTLMMAHRGTADNYVALCRATGVSDGMTPEQFAASCAERGILLPSSTVRG